MLTYLCLAPTAVFLLCLLAVAIHRAVGLTLAERRERAIQATVARCAEALHLRQVDND